MKQRSRSLSVALLLLSLGACTTITPYPESTQRIDTYWVKFGQARPTGAAGSLLLYFDYVRGLPSADYAQELDRARLLAESEKSAYRTLQYALALSQPGGDLRKAQQLLDGLSKESTELTPELRALSILLTSEVAEHRRADAEARKAESEAKRADTEAKRAETETKRVEVETKRADAETKRADELQKKLEALMNIEKNLIQHKKLRR